MTNGPLHILLVEDDPADADLSMRVLSQNEGRSCLHHVSDGAECLRFLRREGPDYAQAPRPHLILLDLNMPNVSGHEVLTVIKEDPSLRKIPVIVLTTSDRETDVIRSYNLGANSFITKPVDIDQFIALIRSLENYWFHLASLPE